MTKINEIWKPVVGYESKYEISNLGNIRSLNYLGHCGIRELQKTYHKGYFKVGLRKNNTQKYLRLHRLVAEAFIPNPNNYPEVNHINGIKSDNRVQNLEWCNRMENMKHARELIAFKVPSGENSTSAKLTLKNVKEIRNLHASGKYSYSQLGKIYSVDPTNIGCIIRGITWKETA